MSDQRDTAYAKINLALHVRRRRPDGYHDLESLFAFAEHGDELSAQVSDDVTLTIDGPFADGLSSGPDNLVMRAAVDLREAFAVTDGAAIHLDKQLPVASGIGGGSADAAAALRMLCRLWGIDVAVPQVMGIARRLGADVPACLIGQTVFGSGRGDDLVPVDIAGLGGTPLLLVNPRIPLGTGPVFAGWDRVDRGQLDPNDYASGRNDLTSAAIALVPQIHDILDQLAGLDGVTLARMSGSGATCFALFSDIAARDAAAQCFAPMWCLVSRLR